MPLLLKPVPAPQGARWLRDGFRLFGKHLIASEAALAGKPIHPGHFLAPLKGNAQRRKRQLALCLAYGAATVLVMVVSDAIDDGKFESLQRLMGQGGQAAEVEALLRDPQLFWGVVSRFGLIAALSVPFWHAPALVHWGDQGPAQALFSSTLAVWRSRGAFAVYLMSWLGIIVAFGGRCCSPSTTASAAAAWGLRPRLEAGAHASGSCAATLAATRIHQSTGVSLAIASASHFTPWRPKFTCARASSPEPSSVMITPSPNLLWNTAWPERQRPTEAFAPDT